MTLDEAIKHCNEQVAKYEKQCEFGISNEGKAYNSRCAAEHKQLAEWLEDLKAASFLLGEAINEMYKGTSCNPTYWLNKYGEAAGELVRRIDYAKM
jgi:hypothetical protein